MSQGHFPFGRIVALTTIGNFAVPISTLATAPLLAQALGAEGRGQAAAALAPTNLVISAATLGIPEAVVFFTGRDPALTRRIAVRGSLILLAVGLLFSMTARVLAPELSGADRGLAELIEFASLTMGPALALCALRASAMASSRWRRVNAEKLLLASLRLSSLAVLYALGQLTVVTAVAALCLSTVVAGCAYLGMSLGRTGGEAGTAPRPAALIGFGLRSWAGAVSGILLSRLDQLLIVPLANPRELGLYAVAVNVGDVPLMFTLAVGSVLLAADAQRRDDVRLAAASRVTVLATTGCALVLGLTTPLWLVPLFGEEFHGSLVPTVILLATAALGGAGSIAGAGLTARGRPGLRSLSLLAACLVNLVLLVLCVPAWGATGAAVAMLVGSVVASTANVLFLRRYYRIPTTDMVLPRPSDLRAIRRVLSSERR